MQASHPIPHLTVLQSAMFLVNSRHRLVTAAPFRSTSKSLHVMRAHLIPKLRCQFAEFLNLGSLKRLGILSPPTCVGLRYGSMFHSTRGFSWKLGITNFALTEVAARRHLSALRGHLWLRMSPAYWLSPQPTRGLATLLRPRSLQRSHQVQEY